MSKRALLLIRSAPHYRRDAFDAGLRAIGYDIVEERQIGTPQPSDVCVIWNRYAHYAVIARRFEAVGATVIIAENGLIGRSENAFAKQFASESQDSDSQLYTLALNFHNGAGRWWIGEPGRWQQQGIEVKPWCEDGEAVLVLGQRGFGPPEVAPPTGWLERTVTKLRSLTHRPIVVRPHPGNSPAKVPLAEDLRNAWCAVCWGSGAGLKAMCAGIPCYSAWPSWVGFPGALPLDQIGLDDPPHWWDGLPLTADAARRVMLDRVAWLQHEVREIASGAPFRRLLDLHQALRKVA